MTKCARQSGVLVAVLVEMARSDDASGLAQMLEHWLIEHCEYLALDTHYVTNNHGVMMDQMLLQASVLLNETHADLAQSWRDVAVRRLGNMVTLTFDEDGCCTENSPIYHLVNLNLFKDIVDFAKDHGLGEAVSSFSTRIARAEAVAPLFLRDDISLPMIGDTGGGPTNLIPPPSASERAGRVCFPNSGFVIINEPKVFFTAKCGGSTYTHRHVDDTSITLRYLGKDLIVDAGMYNYQSNDPVRRWMTSHEAHSGFFVKEFETIDFPFVWKPKNERPDPRTLAKIRDYRDDGDRISMSLSSTHLPGVDIIRNVQVTLPNVIVIEDRLNSDRLHEWRQQFVLHPECKVEIDGNTAIVRRGDVGCEIVNHGNAAPVVDPAKYSDRFMKVQDTHRLSFTGTSSAATVLTTIRMFGDPKAEYSSLAAVEGGFALARPVTVPTFDRDIRLTKQWSVYSGPIKPEGDGFSCSLDGSGGYVMAFNGGFEQQLPATIGQFPLSSASIEVAIPVDVAIITDDQSPKAAIFFMQYDETGKRVSNVSVPIGLSRGENMLRGSFKKADGAKGWNIALKLADFSGRFVIGEAAVSFP